MSQTSLNEPPRDAAGWVLLHEFGTPGAADERAFAAWCAADPAHRPAYATALQTHRVGQLARAALGPAPVVLALADTAYRTVAPAGSRRWLLGATVALAAGIALAAVFGPGLLLWDSYRTGVGERRMVTLPDGSTVTLNGASQLKVRMTGTVRRLELIRGEGLFEVAHDPARPFQVAAGDRIVQAVGTAFDIDRQGTQTSVSVSDGTVALLPLEGAGELRVGKGQGVSWAHEQAPGTVRAVAVEQIGAWRNDILFFDDVPIDTIVTALARRYPGSFKVVDPKLHGRRFSGTITLRDPEQTMRNVALILAVQIQKRGDTFEFAQARRPGAN